MLRNLKHYSNLWVIAVSIYISTYLFIGTYTYAKIVFKKISRESYVCAIYLKKYFLSTYVCVIRFRNVVTNPIIFPWFDIILWNWYWHFYNFWVVFFIFLNSSHELNNGIHGCEVHFIKNLEFLIIFTQIVNSWKKNLNT